MHPIELIVGLGNPGPEYAHTRHNAGAWYLAELARLHGGQLKEEAKFFGWTGRVRIAGRDVRLLIPATFMNRSGKAVAAMANFYQIPPEAILVAHDELDLPPGSARFKQGGGHGGHNGLKDIISCLGNSKDFYRLRLGIGHPGHKSQVAGFVLTKAPAAEQGLLDAAVDEAVRATDMLFSDGMTRAMNRLHAFNADSTK
ncbi:aminoacyl-tRNA hydrolase [Zobellella denitrificans]|uniref:aminoacyl-tRNA hydrolase n=1 Tax=Zobellella denitrificans TaxID=347534 RepID=UPI000B8BD0F4|nr:aminoacyl-tRNA hydrolase [Zobellella denitrificans]OXS15210.1 aminoacyl-tRNA hydrolase [Zobellella denitrificans]